MPHELPPPRSPTWRDRLEALTDRLRELGRDRRSVRNVAAGALLVLGVAVLGFALLKPGRVPPPVELSLPLASASSASGSGQGSGQGSGAGSGSTAPGVVVHAAGAVLRPGLYRLPAGSRVDDLITAAGGLGPGADADRINLAAPLSDGERVFVPRVGEAIPAEAAGPGPSGATAPVNLNTATEAELDALPGIGPSTAKAIVEERTRRGGRFASVEDLLEVRGIGPAKLDQLRSLVTVS